MMVVLLCCLTVTSLGSCTNDNADNGGYGAGGDFSYNLNNVEIVDSGVINTVDLIKDVIDDHSMLEDCDDSIYTDWGRSQYAIIDSQNKAGTRSGAGEGWDSNFAL